MTCGCKEKPCNCNNCPDDGEITILTPLDADECCTGGCGSCGTCKDNCGVNIQSTNDCLTVDTSECGVVKLTSHCPPIVTAGDNITVDKNYDCGDGCSVEYIVSSDCKDEKVKVEGCGNPGYLADLITAGTGIQIDTSCNELVIKNTAIPEKHTEKILDVNYQGALLDVQHYETDTAHVLNITDNSQPYHYAKLILSEDWVQSQKVVSEESEKDSGAIQYDLDSANGAHWLTYKDKKGNYLYSGVDLSKGADGKIVINKHGVYAVGFSGTFECGCYVHAFRAQLYKMEKGVNKRYTLIESRFSAPIGDQPFNMGIQPSAHYVSGVSGGGESDVRVSYGDLSFKVDAPLIGPATDIQWTPRESRGHSASLGAYVSRFPVGGTTIVELDKDDEIFLGCKISSQIKYGGDLMGAAMEKDRSTNDLLANFAFLKKDSKRSGEDQGPECGLTFYVDLIHPLN